MRVPSKIFLFIAIVTLFGCATVDEKRAEFSRQSDARLCLDWMTLPSINIWHPEREDEIQRRGIDCTRYGNIAASRGSADDRFERNLDRMQPKSVNCTSVRSGDVVNTSCR